MTITEAQRSVDAYVSQFKEGYWPPLSNLARLIEEVGELARELNHRYGHKPKKANEPEQDLALELADGAGHGGLGQVKALRGLTEMQGLGDGEEAPQVPCLDAHRRAPSPAGQSGLVDRP